MAAEPEPLMRHLCHYLWSIWSTRGIRRHRTANSRNDSRNGRCRVRVWDRSRRHHRPHRRQLRDDTPLGRGHGSGRLRGVQSRSRFGAGTNPTCLYVFGAAGEHSIGSTKARATMRSVIETMPGSMIDSIPTSDVFVVDP
jgi:hypothetical protein